MDRNLQAHSDSEEAHLGIYCHIPFCASTCDFCAFYQEKPHRADLERYLECMEREFSLSKVSQPVDTIFWGGGTPGLLPAKDLVRLGEALKRSFTLELKEWTIEMAPSTVKPDKLKALKELGVTRISMGVQSFNEALLKSLGRLHAPNQIYQAYDWIREAGFDNVNLDMIFSIPGQDWTLLEADLAEAVRLDPEHLSTYCLTFEEDTALYVKLSQGKITRDSEAEAQLYERTWAYLDNAGYKQYEISNFAKPGKECIHNIHTWEMESWIGFGPSASSQVAGQRFTNVHDLKGWEAGVLAGNLARVETSPLTESERCLDAVIFGLRMNTGVNLAALKERFGAVIDWNALDVVLRDYEEEGLLARADAHIALTLSGRLLADQLALKILELA